MDLYEMLYEDENYFESMKMKKRILRRNRAAYEQEEMFSDIQMEPPEEYISEEYDICQEEMEYDF